MNIAHVYHSFMALLFNSNNIHISTFSINANIVTTVNIKQYIKSVTDIKVLLCREMDRYSIMDSRHLYTGEGPDLPANYYPCTYSPNLNPAE